MLFFKTLENVALSLDEKDVDVFKPKGAVEISNEEAVQLGAFLTNKLHPPHTQQFEINAVARAYLAETDWYVIRLTETGVAIPADVIEQRALSRSAIL